MKKEIIITYDEGNFEIKSPKLTLFEVLGMMEVAKMIKLQFLKKDDNKENKTDKIKKNLRKIGM